MFCDREGVCINKIAPLIVTSVVTVGTEESGEEGIVFLHALLCLYFAHGKVVRKKIQEMAQNECGVILVVGN
jgi:hypothetical protein